MFLELWWDILPAFNGHVNYLRDMFMHCIQMGEFELCAVSRIIQNGEEKIWIHNFLVSVVKLWQVDPFICIIAIKKCYFSKRNNFFIDVYWFNMSSSSWWHAASTNLSDPLSPLVPIVHHSQLIFYATSCITAELLQIGSSWSPYPCSFVWRGPQEYIAYEFGLTSPAVSSMSSSYNLDSLWDGWQVSVQLLLCGMLLPDLFNTSGRILVQLPSNFLFIRLGGFHVVHPYSSIDTTVAWKKNCTLFYLIGLTSKWLIAYR